MTLFCLLENVTDYRKFRRLLAAKAQESPDDAMLASLQLLLSPSGGLPRTSLVGSSMTRAVLTAGKADFNLTSIGCDFASKYVQYLNANYL